ncbi:unnamed protein product [Bursaphelenchus xylophilus]|uniref:(pine wood nematode) hypothetical protein n=1 Tax=Bursaphelenchus xylophilus TaxID=6326 RepID=A0A1I7SQ56_BURXY|nr:unnamed protein product [Bursaphelenchus xylophilus]CAG9109627.1 unnamed protein product [Bursaphelenchus xylophilus]
MRRIYVVRHAEREDNVNSKWRRDYPEFKSDNSPLSKRGRSQCDDLRKYFENIEIGSIYASPFDRTMETASILLGNKENKIKVEPGFIEILYLCEDPPGYWPIDQLADKFPKVDLSYKPVFKTCPPEDDCLERVDKTLRKILDREEDTENIVVVSHGSPVASIYESLTGRYQYIGQATISIFEEARAGSGHFVCIQRAGRDHLSAENRVNLRG